MRSRRSSAMSQIAARSAFRAFVQLSKCAACAIWPAPRTPMRSRRSSFFGISRSQIAFPAKADGFARRVLLGLDDVPIASVRGLPLTTALRSETLGFATTALLAAQAIDSLARIVFNCNTKETKLIAAARAGSRGKVADRVGRKGGSFDGRALGAHRPLAGRVEALRRDSRSEPGLDRNRRLAKSWA